MILPGTDGKAFALELVFFQLLRRLSDEDKQQLGRVLVQMKSQAKQDFESDEFLEGFVSVVDFLSFACASPSPTDAPLKHDG